MKRNKITVLSCGISPRDLTEHHKQILQQADIIAGGKRLLDWMKDYPAEKITITKEPFKTIDFLIKQNKKKVVVLASGDSMLFGIGKLLIKKLPPKSLELFPNISIPQAISSKLYIPLNKISVYSLHGRTCAIPFRQILSVPVALIYLDPDKPPSYLAKKLLEFFPDARKRRCFIAEKLGCNDEKLISLSLQEMCSYNNATLTTLVIINEDELYMPYLAFGLEDEQYLHSNGMITHPEARAIVLSKLKLRPGIMWDIGAGSGSVGIEASNLCSGLKVFAIEKDATRFKHILQNIQRIGTTNVCPIKATAPSVYRNLPPPHIVFIGGGGKDIVKITSEAFRRLLPNGTLVATAIMMETKKRLMELVCTKRRYFKELVELNVARSIPIRQDIRLKAENPLSIFVFAKKDNRI